VRLILDAGGVSALAGHRGRLAEWFKRDDLSGARIPAIVLTEVLTGDHRRDHATNHLLRFCEIHDVDEALAREGARLRTLTGRAGTISVTDAIVVALAARQQGAVIVTSDPKDMTALAEQAHRSIRVSDV